ncbi:unnamed protein product [Closterium sp. NIES-53]
MATPSVLTFDAEGRVVDFEVWVDDLQLFLQCDRADGLSLFDLTSGASPAPPATADSTVRSQWATRDAAARLAVLTRYSSPATAALSRLMLPYLFPDLAAFPTVADLITHLCTSDTRYRAALPAEFCAKNPPPPMYITLYYIVTRLLDSLRSVTDHFLSVCPTTLTVDLLEERLLAPETSIVAVGTSHGDPRTPVLEGCSPSPLLPSVASAAATDLGGFESVGAASAPSGRRRTGKGKRGKGTGGASWGGGGGGGGSGSSEVLIDWIRVTRLQLRERFGSDFPVLRLHSDRGGEFSSARLGAFCRAQGIRQTFTLPAYPQQNGIAERRIGMVMDVARTSMIHAAAPHFLRPFAVQYAAHQLNLQPRVSLPETSPTLRWTGKVGDASAFRFYHPTLRRVLSSQDVTFDESVPYYRVSPVDAVEPVEVAVDSGATRGAEPAGAGSGGVEPEGAEPGGAESRGAEPGGAESGDAESGGAEPGGAEPGGVGSPRVASRGTSSRRELLSPQELREWFARRWSRAAGAGGTTVATGSGGTRTGGTGAARAGGAAEAAGVGPAEGTAGSTGGTGAAGPAGAGAAGVGAAGGVGAGGSAGAGASAGAGVGAVGARGATGAGAATGGTGAVPAGYGGAARPRPYFVPLLQQVLGLLPSTGPAPPLACPHPVQSQSHLQPASPLPAPSPYTGPTGGLAERREPESRPASPVRAARTRRRAPRPRPPSVPGTHQMALRPSTAPLHVPLPSPPESSLPVLADPVSDSFCVASPSFTRLLVTVVIDPSFESTAASALVAELVDFAAYCRLDYSTSLVAESASVCPPSVGGECALSTDVLEDRQEEFQCFAAALPHLVSTMTAPERDPDEPDIPTPRSYAEAIEGPYSSQWQSAMDTEMASWKSTGTYVDEVPPPGANIVSGMWIFRVKRPPGSPPVFKARYVARGFSQRQGVDYFQAFSPTPKMTTLWVLLHVAAQCGYELHSLDFSKAFLQGSLHEEIWLRCSPGFTGSFPPGTQWSLRRPVYGLRQAPRELHDTLRTTLAALGFAPSTTDPSLFLRTDTSLPPFYILVYVDDLVFATADTAGLAHVKSELQKRHTCTDRGPPLASDRRPPR